MATSRQTHYDVLGVPRDAGHGDIVRARDRLVAEFGKDTTPPDPRREARIAEAFAVLSDGARREAYDATLAGQQDAPAAPDRRKAIVAGGVAVALAAVAAVYFLGFRSPPAKPGRTAQEIQADVARSVGRVQSIDVSGKATPTGLAFTVAKGVMATPCEGLAPGAQIVVTIGTRAVPARIDSTDEALGLCKLAVEGAGSWPLTLGGAVPAAGDKVYAAGLSAAGDVVLAEGEVKRIVEQAGARVVEASVAAGAGPAGRPLLDGQGSVVGVAIAPPGGGAARYVFVPARWASESPAPAASSAPEPGASPKAPPDADSAQSPKSPGLNY